MVGIVISCGKDVSVFELGDCICGLFLGGGYVEKVIIFVNLVILLFDSMLFMEGVVIFEVFFIVFQVFDWLVNLQVGECVFIYVGVSGVGIVVIQFVKRMGVGEIFVIVFVKKYEICCFLGVDYCIDYCQENYSEVVLDKMDGKGVDVLIDFVGGFNFVNNLKLMNVDGCIVMFVFFGGLFIFEVVNLVVILCKCIYVMGFMLCSRSKVYKVNLINDL